eukprot:gnl/TRDRNA2_/TRDRNA2_45601_c0_seq1.p1 gnl/TRDRNA2_/TRDRNA2_45601_c0~~gnl/TRDRNA2_/TRDRNA2_45601_c0_seq1.p1  ORF type:complete len:269 (-),score=61.99 gnl/TRDRNA2_/TRDRNA2_45601_c0_seq1:66-872(-)
MSSRHRASLLSFLVAAAAARARADTAEGTDDVVLLQLLKGYPEGPAKDCNGPCLISLGTASEIKNDAAHQIAIVQAKQAADIEMLEKGESNREQAIAVEKKNRIDALVQKVEEDANNINRNAQRALDTVNRQRQKAIAIIKGTGIQDLAAINKHASAVRAEIQMETARMKAEIQQTATRKIQNIKLQANADLAKSTEQALISAANQKRWQIKGQAEEALSAARTQREAEEEVAGSQFAVGTNVLPLEAAVATSLGQPVTSAMSVTTVG